MRKALLTLFVPLTISCGGPLAERATSQGSYGVHVDAPRAGTFVQDPEIDVVGTFTTYDGRGWVWVDQVEAHVEGNRFVARHVPLREGAMQLAISLTDGQGRRTVQH